MDPVVQFRHVTAKDITRNTDLLSNIFEKFLKLAEPAHSISQISRGLWFSSICRDEVEG